MTVFSMTFRELLGKRVLLFGGLLSTAFIGLYTLGLTMLSRELGAADDELGLVGTLLALLALYVVSFLGSFLGLVLSAGSVAAEVDNALIHAVLARPLSRRRWLLQRWAALALIVSLYVSLMATTMMALARAILVYEPHSPVGAVAFIALQAVSMTTIGLLLSTRLSTIASGAIAFAGFGIAWLAGIVEYIGSIIGNTAMVNTGIATSLLVPTDALWRAASYYSVNARFVDEALGPAGGLPFASAVPPTGAFILWVAVYLAGAVWLAVRWLVRRDL